ncbi:dockerin type I domain-containing protein, partial [Gottfriedia acidiceleris]|uniref:dockerin type I domain-containing protein n=1 Tax=Gottfriedia acidiceleris TaxID=371036 RepID=UPI002FFFFFAF
KLNGISQKSINFNLNIPKTAEKGTYEGYITFTNTGDPSETYQIPFGGRVVNEGIDSVDALPIFSTDTAWPENAWPFESFSFSLKSHMKTLDIVLLDPTTGEDLGLIGSLSPITLNENQTYYVSRGFTGTYYPFTGDSKNPIAYQPEIAQPGRYRIKMVGSNEQGKTFIKSADFIYDLGAPTMTSSFDSLDQKVIETNDSEFDSNGEFLYNFNINLNDPETEEASKLGFPVDQSNNSVVTFFNSPWPKNPVQTDKNGNYTDQLVVRKQSAPLQVQFYGMDYARNFTANAFNMLRVVFVDHNLPYYYLKANKQTVTSEDTVNYSVRSNNVKNLKTSKITIPVDSTLASIQNVVVNDAVKQYGDAKVSVSTAQSGSYLNYTITFTYLGDKALPEDLKLFNFDLKTAKKFTDGLYGGSAFNWLNVQASTTDQLDVVTNNVYSYMESIKYKPTYSRLDGTVRVEGANDPTTGQLNYALDQSAIGAKVTVTSYDGKTSVSAPSFNKSGQYIIDGLKAETNPYTVTVDVPGHFTMSRQLVLSNNVRGEIVGKRLAWNLPTAAAGDVNKDNVIDILDALAVQTYWGTNKATADFNFDKVVDKKDMDYIVKNFGLKNPTVSNAPKAKTAYKGVTLDDVLTQLGLQ